MKAEQTVYRSLHYAHLYNVLLLFVGIRYLRANEVFKGLKIYL